MKIWPALAVTGGLVASLLVAPAATAAEPSLSNVRIAWKDSTFQKVTVTWDSDGTRPTGIVVRDPAGRQTSFPLPAEGSSIEVEARLLEALESTSFQPLQFAVLTGDSAPAALSPKFDANVPKSVGLVSTTQSAAGATTVRWSPPAPATDTTPNDPLDRSVAPTYQVTYKPLNGKTAYPIGGRTAATQTTYTLRSEYTLDVVAHNEWGGRWAETLVTARATKLSAKIPGWTVYGQQNVHVTGTYSPVLSGGNFRPIVLQARNSATGPWYAVSTFTGNASGKFSFTLGSAGRRQYRVATAALVTNGGASLHYGAVTGSGWSSTQMWGDAAFTRFSIPVGRTDYAVLNAYPAVNTTATLQRWNGKAWTTVGPVQVRNGRGTGAIVPAKPGRVAYRYYLPTSTFRGLRVEAAYTANFVVEAF